MHGPAALGAGLVSPPGGTVRLLLGEDVLAPSQTPPVLPFGWAFRTLPTLDVLQLSWSFWGLFGHQPNGRVHALFPFPLQTKQHLLVPTVTERSGLGSCRETVLAARVWDRCFCEDIFYMSRVTP